MNIRVGSEIEYKYNISSLIQFNDKISRFKYFHSIRYQIGSFKTLYSHNTVFLFEHYPQTNIFVTAVPISDLGLRLCSHLACPLEK